MYDASSTVALDFSKDSITQGNKHKLNQNHCILRKHFFTSKIVAIWNSLPGYVLDANSINIFKNHLDNHWCMQDILYDFQSELAGIGNRNFE